MALISAFAIVSAALLPAWLIERARKENADDHAYVRRALTRVERKIDNHLEDHNIHGAARRTTIKNKPVERD